MQFHAKTTDKYIGESDDISRRLSQHKNSVRHMDPNSALVKHITDADHRVSINDAVVISRVSNCHQRKLFESALIKQVPNFNIYKTAFDLDDYTSRLLFENIPSLQRAVMSLDPG